MNLNSELHCMTHAILSESAKAKSCWPTSSEAKKAITHRLLINMGLKKRFNWTVSTSYYEAAEGHYVWDQGSIRTSGIW